MTPNWGKGGAVDVLEVQAVIQKDLGELEELTGKNSVEFSNEEGKVAHLERNVSSEGRGSSCSVVVRPHLQYCIQFCVHASPQYKRDVGKTEQVQHKAATMSGSGSSALKEKSFMGAWQCAPTVWQTMRKGAGPQAMVVAEVRVVLTKYKDNVFF